MPKNNNNNEANERKGNSVFTGRWSRETDVNQSRATGLTLGYVTESIRGRPYGHVCGPRGRSNSGLACPGYRSNGRQMYGFHRIPRTRPYSYNPFERPRVVSVIINTACVRRILFSYLLFFFSFSVFPHRDRNGNPPLTDWDRARPHSIGPDMFTRLRNSSKNCTGLFEHGSSRRPNDSEQWENLFCEFSNFCTRIEICSWHFKRNPT